MSTTIYTFRYGKRGKTYYFSHLDNIRAWLNYFHPGLRLDTTRAQLRVIRGKNHHTEFTISIQSLDLDPKTHEDRVREEQEAAAYAALEADATAAEEKATREANISDALERIFTPEKPT